MHNPTSKKRASAELLVPKLDETRKARIVALLRLGFSVAEVARQAGVSRDSVYRWRDRGDEVSEELIQAQREGIVQALYRDAERFRDFLTDEKLSKASARDLMVMRGIALDKAQALEPKAGGMDRFVELWFEHKMVFLQEGRARIAPGPPATPKDAESASGA